MLTARDLSYRLPNGRMLFSNVSLDVGPGEAVAIEGPSGTGKTTLLAVLGGVLAPTTGSVDVDAAHPAPFAWVLQTLNSLGARTVMDNAALFALLDGEARSIAMSRARASLTAVGIEELSRSTARQLSGGELQRLAVARALASRRPILLADEPSNQLDRTNARLVMSALAEAAHDHVRSVVIVTHDRESLSRSTRVLQLNESGLYASK